MRCTATRRRRGWPSSASSPSSTGDRRAPGSPRRTAARSGSTRGWGSPRRCSARISSRSSPGRLAIGHVRYSTTGSSVLSNAQPFLVHHADEYYALAHNGNLINALELRAELEERGSIFQSTMDSEVIVHLMAPHLKEGLETALTKALAQVQGAYSIVMLTRNRVIAVRDPRGFRPLCPRPVQRRLGRGLGDLRLRPRRGEIRPGRPARRDHHHRRGGAPQPDALCRR